MKPCFFINNTNWEHEDSILDISGNEDYSLFFSTDPFLKGKTKWVGLDLFHFIYRTDCCISNRPI